MTDDRAAAFKTADCRTLELTKTSRQTGGETELFERLWLLNDSEGRLSTSFWLSVSFCASFELAAILSHIIEYTSQEQQHKVMIVVCPRIKDNNAVWFTGSQISERGLPP